MNDMKKMLSAVGAVSAAVAIVVFGWIWMFCRISVGPGEMAIVTSKTGDELPPGAILAEPGQKGVQRMPLAEGRHFLNPINNDWTIVPARTISAGSKWSYEWKSLPSFLEPLVKAGLHNGWVSFFIWAALIGSGITVQFKYAND